MVAFALGQENEKLECYETAKSWFLKAEGLFPLEKWKNKAREAAARVENQRILQRQNQEFRRTLFEIFEGCRAAYILLSFTLARGLTKFHPSFISKVSGLSKASISSAWDRLQQIDAVNRVEGTDEYSISQNKEQVLLQSLNEFTLIQRFEPPEAAGPKPEVEWISEISNIPIEALTDTYRLEEGHVKYVRKVWEETICKLRREELPFTKGEIAEVDYWRDREGEGNRLEDVIVDPLAFYVPYHTRPEVWGIYLREHRLQQDFEQYLAKIIHLRRFVPGAARLPIETIAALALRRYLLTVYLHELCHHVIEDDTSIQAKFKAFNYPLAPSVYEEGFCEFHAFAFGEKGAFLPFSSLYKFALIRLRPKEKTIFSTILYYHWNRHTSHLYKPYVHPRMVDSLSPAWSAIWAHHIRGGRLLMPPPKRREVYTQLYLTTL